MTCCSVTTLILRWMSLAAFLNLILRGVVWRFREGIVAEMRRVRCGLRVGAQTTKRRV